MKTAAPTGEPNGPQGVRKIGSMFVHLRLHTEFSVFLNFRQSPFEHEHLTKIIQRDVFGF